jgi:hypothetical protein
VAVVISIKQDVNFRDEPVYLVDIGAIIDAAHMLRVIY